MKKIEIVKTLVKFTVRAGMTKFIGEGFSKVSDPSTALTYLSTFAAAAVVTEMVLEKTDAWCDAKVDEWLGVLFKTEDEIIKEDLLEITEAIEDN